tara:strand:- start:187 stop:882 length:696 start_codon:yes stop_codon:yes gene_type:complete
METESQIEQVKETTGGSDSQVEASTNESRSLSQDEVNRIVAERVERERKKFERRFADVDMERYQKLTEADEARKVEDQKKRGEFDNILKETVSKKNSVIQNLQKELHTIKIDGAMLNLASKRRAINPEQVVNLVKDSVRMNETGDVEVIDTKTNTVRYTEKGDPMGMDDLVAEFLNANPHFLSATAKGSGTKGNVRDNNTNAPLDITKLDFKNPDHRKLYAEYRKTSGLAS